MDQPLAAAETEVKVQPTAANELRSILGMNLQGTSLGEFTEVWLPRMGIDDAVICGATRVLDEYGSQKPEASGAIE